MTNVTPRVSFKRPQCNHDPLFTNDGRCSKCYPPRPGYFASQDALLGRRATPPGWFVNPAVTLELDDIAEMCLRCDEQRIDRDTNAGMCN